MAAGSTIGPSGRLLGTVDLQRAIDGFNKGVSELSGIVKGFNAFKGGYQSGSLSSSLGWSARTNPNTAMNAMGSGLPIGGGATFGGQPMGAAPINTSQFAPGTPLGGTTTFGGRTYATTSTGLFVPPGAAPVPTPNGGVPTSRFPWLPSTTAGRMGVAGAAVGYTAEKFGQVDRIMGNTSERSDSILMDTSMRMGVHGPGIAGMAPRLFGSGAAQDTADEAMAAAYLSTQTGHMAGSAGWMRMKGMGVTATTFDPTASLTQSLQTTGQFHTATAFNKMRMVGIQTAEGGRKLSPTEIAQQIIDQLDPDKVIQTKAQVAFVVDDPSSKLNMSLDAWVQQGVLSQEMADMMRTHIRRILQARVQGVGSRELERLTKAADIRGERGAAARERLKEIGIRDTAEQSQRDRAGSERESTAMRLKGWADATIRFNESTEQFHDDVNALSKALGLSPLFGLFRAVKQDPFGAVLTLLTGQGETPATNRVQNQVARGETPSPSSVGVAGMEQAGAAGIGGSGFHGMSSLGPGSGSPGLAAQFGVTGGHGAGDLAGAASANTNAGSKTNDTGTKNSAQSGAGTAGAQADKGNARNKQTGQKLQRPVPGAITRPYGFKDSGYAKGYHTGTDFDGSTGDPIRASADGNARVPAFDSDGYGRYVILSHGNGIETWYAHMVRAKVNSGSAVKQGQVIGYIGETGNTSGSHLHFEVRINGKDVDPMKYIGESMGMTGASGTASGASANGSTSDSSEGAGAAMAVGFSASEAANLQMPLLGVSSSVGFGSNTPTDNGDSGSKGKGADFSGISGGGNVTANISLGKQMAARMGWTGRQWDALKELWTGESGWNHQADNPSSSAYGIPQALVKYPGRKMPAGYYDPQRSSGEGGDFQGKGGDPKVQIQWGLNYIKNNGNFHDPLSALNFWKSNNPHWYAQGAWDIEKDQQAVVHKGEMVIPSAQARQIREVLLHSVNNGSRSTGEQASIVFEEGSIQVSLGSGVTPSQGRVVGKQIADAIADDRRIKRLMQGAS